MRSKKKLPCPHCGASMAMNYYSLNKTLLRALIKLVRDGGMSMTHIEKSVYTKLKYWRFIRQITTTDGDKKWLVTDLGKQFLAGKTSAPKELTYFRDNVVEMTGEIFVWQIVSEPESRQKYVDMMRPFLGTIETGAET